MRWSDFPGLAVVAGCTSNTPPQPPSAPATVAHSWTQTLPPSDADSGPDSTDHTGNRPATCTRVEIDERLAEPNHEQLLDANTLVYLAGLENGWDPDLPPLHPADWNLPAGRLLEWHQLRDRGWMTYIHDDQGRMVLYQSQGRPGRPPSSWTWTYADGLLVRYESEIYVSQDVAVTERVELSYDEPGRLATTEWFQDDVLRHVVRYAYGASGTSTATVDSVWWGGAVDEVWRYVYDEQGRIVEWGGGARAGAGAHHFLTYDEQGNLVEDRGVDLDIWWGLYRSCVRWTYDTEGRVARVVHDEACGDEAEALGIEDYTYDERGNWIRWEASSADGRISDRWTWTYDELNRRTSRFVEIAYYFTPDEISPYQTDSWTYEDDVPCSSADDTLAEEERRAVPVVPHPRPDLNPPRAAPTLPGQRPPVPGRLGAPGRQEANAAARGRPRLGH